MAKWLILLMMLMASPAWAAGGVQDSQELFASDLHLRHAELVSASTSQHAPQSQNLARPWTLKQVQGDGVAVDEWQQLSHQTEPQDNTVVVVHRRAESMMAVPIAVTVISSEDLRKSRREKRKHCKQAWKGRKDLDALFGNEGMAHDDIASAADAMWDGQRGCKQRRDYALALMERLVGPDPVAHLPRNYADTLVSFHRTAKRPESANRIRDIKRGQWLRGAFYGKAEELGWTEEERLAYVARDDVWKFLNAQGPQAWHANDLIAKAYLTPGSPRFDLAKGADFVEQTGHTIFGVAVAKRLLSGDGLPKDAERAERMLVKIAQHAPDAQSMLVELAGSRLNNADPEVRDVAFTQLSNIANASMQNAPTARAALLPILAARLKAVDDKQAVGAAQTLSAYAESKTPGAAAVLLPWIDKRLQRGTEAQKADGRNALARLMRTGDAQARALFETDLQRTGGLVDLGLATPEMLRNRTLFTTNDYPPSAIRQEEEGIVRLSLIVGPDGRVIDATSVEPGTSPILIGETIRIVWRRAKFNLPANMPGRYAKVRLPDVQWRLAECMKDAPPTPAAPGATVVDSWCRNR